MLFCEQKFILSNGKQFFMVFKKVYLPASHHDIPYFLLNTLFFYFNKWDYDTAEMDFWEWY